MATTSRIHVRISNGNYRQLKRLALEHDAHMGRLVDDALTLLFTPADQRPDAVILRRLNLIERQLDTIDANSSFQTDLFVEYLSEWLRTRPIENPLWSAQDEARVQSDLNAITSKVIERAGRIASTKRVLQ